MTIIYFADSYKGGTNIFLEQNIKYNLERKQKVIVFSKNFTKIFPNVKKNKNLTFFNLDVFNDNEKIKKKIKKTFNQNNIFFFTNYAVLVYYFFLFAGLKKNNNKLSIALHSGIFNYKIKTIIGLLLFSVFALKLDYIIFGSNSSKQWWFKFFPWLRSIRNKIIFNGVEKQKKKALPNKKMHISFIGRLEKENDPNMFLQLYQLNKNVNNIKFNVFGDGSLKVKLNKKFKKVKFWGWTKKKRI